MKKENKIAVAILAVLAGVVAVAMGLNKDVAEANKATFENVQINILLDGAEVGLISYDELLALESNEFEAIYDTSNTEPVLESYRGVELKLLLEEFGIALEDKKAVVLTAVDNYAMAYSVEEVMQDDNVYVAYEREGEAILGKEDGGAGPLQAIVTSDKFSNRRCKWLISVEVQS
ncbi:MAG: molybdopterin-dependent oxidoreductase [Bacillota bacterium]